MATRFIRKFLFALGFLALGALNLIPPSATALAAVTWYDVQTLQEASDERVSGAAYKVLGDARMWRAETSPIVLAAPFYRWVPMYGGDLAQAPQFDVLAGTLLDAGDASLAFYDSMHGKLAAQHSFGAGLIAAAREDAGQIEAARKAVEGARAQREQIDERDLSPQAHGMLEMIDRALGEWDAVLRLLPDAPALLGEDGARRYLVLAQNNDELRPTGGFISAAGVLKVEHGEISVDWFGDSFAADDLSLIHPPPPAPLEKYMDASQWLLRDANWYADFPTTADVAETMVSRDRHVQTDGVIAVDMRLLPRLVGAMGDVELAGQPLAQNNVIDLMKASWKPMPPGDMSAAWFNSDRKNFLSDLMNGMLTRFRAGDVPTGALAQALWHGLREKSVQIYLNDTEAEQAVLDAGWGGAVEAGTGDRLFVVDSNVGFNKVNATVTREILYDVRLNDAGGDATVDVTYTNPSRAAEGGCDLLNQHKDNTYAGMEQSCYWDYVRVLAPRDSQFVSASGVTDGGVTDDIEAVSAFGGYAIVPRDAVQTVQFRYTLPKSVIQNDVYTLYLQQQAGAAGTPVAVRVQVPAGRSVRGTSAPFVWRGGNVMEFREMLYGDTTLRIYFR